MSRNPAFSLRALARSLGVSHTYLSLILNGKKTLSLKRAIQFAQLLGLDKRESDLFIETAKNEASGRLLERLQLNPEGSRARAKKVKQQRFFELESDRFHIVADWYHFPIMVLTETKGFRQDPKWIAQRLGISPEQVVDGIDRLKRLGLLEEKNGQLRKSDHPVLVRPKRADVSVRTYHEKMIAMALEALSKVDFEARDFNGYVIPVNVSRIPEAKKRIAKFCVAMMEFLSEGECTELFQLNLQLFPLTNYKPAGPVLKTGEK